MNLKETILTPTRCADCIDVNQETVTRFCRNGHIRAKQKKPKSHWEITAYDFMDFLYKNPKYADYYRDKSFDKYSTFLKEHIFFELRSRPQLYAWQDVAKLFGVTLPAVRYWIMNGTIVPVGKTSYNSYLFSTESIIAGVTRNKNLFIRLIENQKDLCEDPKLQDLRALCLREGYRNAKRVSKNYA